MTLSFFRRHRKWFMVLMFAALVGMMFFGSWSLMGPKFQQWFGGGPGSRVIGSIAGKNVRERDARQFYAEIYAAGQAAQAWAMMLEPRAATPEARARAYRATIGATAWPLLRESLSGERPLAKAVLAWMGLFEEARAAGFDTSGAEVQERLRSIEDLGVQRAVTDRLAADLAGGSREAFVQALRKDMTLRSYMDYLYETLGGAVTPAVRREFAKMDDRIQVRLAVLRAGDFLSEVKDVPEADVRQQFEKGKAHPAGKGPDGCGYRIPDRISLEYLAADPEAFLEQAQARVTDADVRRYYEEHKDPEFVVREEKPPAAGKPPADEKPAATEKPAEKPAAKPADKPAEPKAKAAEKPAAPAPAGAKGEAGPAGATAPAAPPVPKAEPPAPAATKAEAKSAEPMVSPAAAPKVEAPAALMPEVPAPPSPGAAAPAAGAASPAPPGPAARPAPPEKKFRPLQDVQEGIRKTLVQEQAAAMARENLIAAVAEIRPMKKPPDLRIWADGKKIRHAAVPGFLSAAQLAALAGIGKAARGSETLAETAVALAELVGHEKAKLGVMETSEPFIGPDGDAYALRVTAFQASHEPASLDEVKDQVIADLRTAKAFEIARENGRKLLEEAGKTGLNDAAEAAKIKTAESDWVAQERFIPYGGQLVSIPASLPEVGSNRLVVSECFRMAAES